MALFKISKGLKSNLPSTKTEGYCWFTTDDGKFYIDVNSTTRQILNAGHADTAGKLIAPRKINISGDVFGAVDFDGSKDVTIATTLLDSGVGAGNYGLSQNATPSFGEKINIPYITVDSKGRVTIASTKTATIPSSEATDLEAGLMSSADKVKLDGIDTSNYLKKTGDTMTGYLALTENIGYGTTLPENPVEGQIFFLEEEENNEPSLPKGGSAGQYLVKKSDKDGDAEWQTLNLPELNYLPLTGGTVTGDLTVTGNITGAKVYGAVWNDYAEYRGQKEEIKPGYCVASANNGQVYKTTEKFQACDGIVSDTFGFAIGETDECKTPLAVAGRVLAYCEGDKYNYNAGDTVCAGPDGRVCKMTREEVREWPDRIVGIVSEIPEYDTWGTGNVKVDGRIWIKVK